MTTPEIAPGIVVVDRDGVVLEADERARSLLVGYAPGPLGRRLVGDCTPDSPGLVRYRWEHQDGSSGAIDGVRVARLSLPEEGSVIVLWPSEWTSWSPSLMGAGSTFLEAVLDSVEEGIVACDAEGRLALFNRASRRLHGLPEERLPAGEWAEHYSLYRADGTTPMPTEEIPLLRAFRSEEVDDEEMVIAVPGREPRTLLASGRAILDSTGVTIGAVVSMRDVTEQRRAEEAERLRMRERAAREAAEQRQRRAAFLSRISARLDASLGVERRLQELVDELVPELADACIVRLGGSDDAAIVASAHRDDALREGLARLQEAFAPRPDSPGSFRVIATGDSEMGSREDAGWDQEIDPAIGELGIHSYLAVPLRARGRTLGALSLLATDPARTFGSDEQRLADEIGRRAGVAIDNARLFEEEQEARLSAERERRRTTQLQDLALGVSGASTSVEVADVIAGALGDVLGSDTACVVHGGDAAALSSDRSAWAACLERLGGQDKAAALTRQAIERGANIREAANIALVPLGSIGDERQAIALVAHVDVLPTGDLARQLAAMAVIARQALARAAGYDNQRELAEALQRSLLPSRLPQPTFAEIAVHYAPARGSVGGDFYDAVQDGARLSIVVGDVVGQGAPAAAVMGQLRSAWRTLIGERLGPQEIITRMSALSHDIEGATVATMVCACLEDDGCLTYAAAGHPPPLLRRATGGIEYLWEGRGTPLGVGSRAQGVSSITLETGDLLLLVTDGIIERPNQSIDAGLADLERLAGEDTGEGPEALLRRIGSANCDARDDCALLAVRFAEP